MRPDPKCVPIISRDEIRTAVARLAGELNRDYRGKEPLVIGVLRGAFVFMADLVRLLDFPLEVDFIRLASYGAGKESSGEVRVLLDVGMPVAGRHLIVVEDIVDTGITAAWLVDHLKERAPLSVKLCALVDKPSRRRVPVTIDYLGLTVPDKFLVGYGLDYQELYRNLPYVGIVDPKKNRR